MNGDEEEEMKGMTMELYDYHPLRIHTHHHHQQQQQKRDAGSDEGESKGSGEMMKKQKQKRIADGESIDAIRRPRGRPPGSKNKPKPPVVITREVEPSAAMRPHVLEIPGGHDVADALARFARQRSLGICVLSGTGSVANVTLRQPTAMPDSTPTVGFRGVFEILSISATFMPPSIAATCPSSVSISLAGPQGRILGGTVVGPLISAGTVMVIAAAFSNPTFHRLPADDELSGSVSGGDVEPVGRLDDRDPHHLHRPQQPSSSPAAESCGMSIYSCHLPSDVIWAPTLKKQGGREVRQYPKPTFLLTEEKAVLLAMPISDPIVSLLSEGKGKAKVLLLLFEAKFGILEQSSIMPATS